MSKAQMVPKKGLCLYKFLVPQKRVRISTRKKIGSRKPVWIYRNEFSFINPLDLTKGTKCAVSPLLAGD